VLDRTGVMKMKCSRFRKLLMPYAEGSLPEEISDSMEQHLAECESCARELRSLACTVGVLKQVEYPAMEPAADLRSRVLAQISPEPARRSWWQTARLQAYSAAAAGLLLIAIAGAGMWSMLQRGIEVPATREVAQKADRLYQPPKAPAPSATGTALQGTKAGVAPRKPTAKKAVSGLAGGAAAFAPMARMPLYADEYLLQGGARDRAARSGSPGTEEEAVAVPDASAGLPKASGYGVMEDAAQPPVAPSRPPSQELANSMKQSDSGGTQSFMYRGGPEGVSSDRPAAYRLPQAM
jgi:hypothetical protein